MTFESTPELNPDDQVQFLNFHRPRLRSGDYVLTIKQSIKEGDITAQTSQYFSVTGKRFALESSDIHLVYPPSHSQGDFDRTLPHIVLNSDTLPWQRTPRGDGQDEILAPTWMALLVFTAEEAKQIEQRTCTVKDLKVRADAQTTKGTDHTRPWIWPGIREEVSQHDEDGAVVIGVPWPLLRTQLPTYQDLYSTAHVRTVSLASTSEQTTSGLAVIVAARLPPRETACVAYLVSLEHRYDDASRTNHAYPDGQNVFSFPKETSDEQHQMQQVLEAVEERLHAEAQALDAAIKKEDSQAGINPERRHILGRLGTHLTATVVIESDKAPSALAPNMMKVIADINAPLTEAQIRPYLPDQQADLDTDGHRVSYELCVAGVGTLQAEAQTALARTPHGHLTRSLVVKLRLPDMPFRLDWDAGHAQDTTYTPIRRALLSLLNAVYAKGARGCSVKLEAGKLPRTLVALGDWQEANYPDLKPANADDAKAMAQALLPSRPGVAATGDAPAKIWVQFTSGEQAEVAVDITQEEGSTTITHFTISPARKLDTMKNAYTLPSGSDPKQSQPPLIILEPGLPPIWYSPVALTGSSSPNGKQIEQMCLGTLNRHSVWESHYNLRGSLDLSQDIAVNGRVIRTALRLSRDTMGVQTTLQIAPIVQLYFDHQGAEEQPEANPPLVQLVSLHRWEFECTAEGRNFVGLLEGLDGVRMQNGVKGSAELQMRQDLGKATSEPGATGLAYLRAGYTLLPHRMREGSRTISWYRGPLIPRLSTKSDANTLPLPAHAADGLLIYDKVSGMFDSSYAAAWELGRTLALADTHFATQLYQWKRAYAHSITRQLQYVDHSYLPGQHHLPQSADLPQPLADWLDALTRLEGVPFNYLIPTEALLPAESIRFFDLDPLWIECLRDGALSIGRVLQVNHSRDVEVHDGSLPEPPDVSGFLLRSQVVAHYPKLEVAGFSLTLNRINELNQSPNWSDQAHVDGLGGIGRLPILRLARLAPDLLLGLYIGSLDMVEFHLPPQILHFGFEMPGAPEQYRATSPIEAPLVKLLRDLRSGDLLDFVVDTGVAPDELIDIVRLGPKDIRQALDPKAPSTQIQVEPVPAEILYLLITTAHYKSGCLEPVTFSQNKDQYQAELSHMFSIPYDSTKEPYRSIEAQLMKSGTTNTLAVNDMLALKDLWKPRSGLLGAEQWGWLLRLTLRGMRIITLNRNGNETPYKQLKSLYDEACKDIDWQAYSPEDKRAQAGTATTKDRALQTLWWCVDKHIAETLTLDTTLWHDRDHDGEWIDPQPKDFGSDAYWTIRNRQILNFKHLFDTIADRLAPALGGRAITAGDFALQMLDAAPLVRLVRLPPTKEAS